VGIYFAFRGKRLTKDEAQITCTNNIVIWFCAWLMWLCTWLHQWHPIIFPIDVRASDAVVATARRRRVLGRCSRRPRPCRCSHQPPPASPPATALPPRLRPPAATRRSQMANANVNLAAEAAHGGAPVPPPGGGSTGH
jgi:hypothetical protein